MPASWIACPYCNAQLTPPPGVQFAQRLPCPRCGESFPYRGPPLDEPAALEPASLPVAAPEPARWSNGAIARLVLLGMFIMAGLGLAFALNTVDVRRSHDMAKPPRAEFLALPLVLRVLLGVYLFGLAYVLARSWFQRERTAAQPALIRYGLPVALTAVGAVLLLLVLRPRPLEPNKDKEPLKEVFRVPPAQLTGLGYLPDDVNTVAGVHIGEALQTPAGRELLGQLQLGGLRVDLDTLEKWTGLKADELDHVVIGAQLGKSWPPPVTLVVQTRRPYEEKKVRAAFPSQGHSEKTNKPLHSGMISLGKYQPRGDVWFAAPRSLVVFLGVPATRIDAIPAQPPSGAGRLPENLRRLLEDETRLDEGRHVWLAGRTEDWSKDLLAAAAFFSPEAKALEGLTAFTAGLHLGEALEYRVVLDCTDAKGAEKLLDQLRSRGDVQREKATLTLAGRTTPADVQKLLGQVRPEVGKK